MNFKQQKQSIIDVIKSYYYDHDIVGDAKDTLIDLVKELEQDNPRIHQLEWVESTELSILFFASMAGHTYFIKSNGDLICSNSPHFAIKHYSFVNNPKNIQDAKESAQWHLETLVFSSLILEE